ncbi:peroxisomal membrane protein PMP34 isoform X2 [Parasteatoda tepidariorum]|uniref:peroxisomal membrane protein PMP34 isoform X2 n=1 Tax=Parasteatoda tepidariorum TaxID=114398 RepID=UPI00077FA7BC|nr:peroxisomal membrane protein PMP34 isoform X2 [Parasteatoda tepidariorum]
MDSKKLFSYETFVRAVSGAAGGVTAMTVFFPLDTIRSRLQIEDSRQAKNTIAALKELVQEEGLYSLYRGLQPVLISLCCSNFVYFYTFHGLRKLVVTKSTGYNALRDLAVGSVAGVINVLLTTPLWVANSRLKMQGAKLSSKDKKMIGENVTYKGLIDALNKIATKEGVSSLWSSVGPSLILVSNPAIQFACYETLKTEVSKHIGKDKLNAVTLFLIGAVAKSISTILTYPLQVVQTKLRHGSETMRKLTTLRILSYIIKTNGVRGLYKGLEAKLLQTVLTTALMFLCYEKIVIFIFYIMKAPKHRSE